MSKRLFIAGGVLLALAVYCGLVVTFADQYLHADLSLGLPSAARTLIAVFGALVALALFFAADDFDNWSLGRDRREEQQEKPCEPDPAPDKPHLLKDDGQRLKSEAESTTDFEGAEENEEVGRARSQAE